MIEPSSGPVQEVADAAPARTGAAAGEAPPALRQERGPGGPPPSPPPGGIAGS